VWFNAYRTTNQYLFTNTYANIAAKSVDSNFASGD
jgi:hypothetical protein